MSGVSLTAAQFSTKQREDLAKRGVAMRGGGFPIRNRSDLKNAIMAFGRAGDKAAAKRHIIKRARALDAVDMLPEGWGVTASLVASSKNARKRKIDAVMREFKNGTLKSSTGQKVTDRKQALAIALSMARELTAAGRWDESKHPRDPGGEGGGQWTSKGEAEDSHTPTDDERDDYEANLSDELEARAQEYIAKGYQPSDGEPGEWITLTHPDTGDEITLDVNDEYDPPTKNESYAQAVDQAAMDVADRLAESMSHGEGEEGLGDAASQGRGYGDQIDEDLQMMYESGEIEDVARDYADELAQDDPEFDGDAFVEEIRKAAEKKLREGSLEASGALTAAAAGLAPVVPPRAWFEKPKLDGPTPITVTADGRIYGHAALWGTCHTGISGTCRTPPRSQSSYQFFHLGEVDTDGGPVSVGRVTMNTGHAPLTASRESTVRHYDDTGTGAAHVRAYEDDHGIVLAGAVVPDLSAADARRLKGAPVSGDWRSIGGKLELVGMLAVNVPGFPVPRAMAASLMIEDEPHTMALVAAGVYCDPKDVDRKIKALTARAKGVDGLAELAMGGSEQKRRMGAVVAAIRDPAPSVES